MAFTDKGVVTCKSIKHASYLFDRNMKNKPIYATHSSSTVSHTRAYMMHTHTHTHTRIHTDTHAERASHRIILSFYFSLSRSHSSLSLCSFSPPLFFLITSYSTVYIDLSLLLFLVHLFRPFHETAMEF